ncbi:hypothetical protein GIB67_006703 [Kingdonia uniflora]|uniref:Mediator of RNA polymerase II transcription subunit 27 n=1 Tax=Kingdonia uniflora TaxID=39325 RepID=A0A7J7LYV6_9MAGN|nr:hypothetical protein GIB67_006703 [Kingdonia uniflora]
MESSPTEAPPKQVAVAMDRLSNAARLIADIRIGADRILEALFIAAQPHPCNKPLHMLIKEESSMRQRFQDLRTLGKQLEDSGVLNSSLRSRSKSWGLHMPLVCPDGAVVAYAWKRQLAGQAGASAVDRTGRWVEVEKRHDLKAKITFCLRIWQVPDRLALKAFTDQKRRYFPDLGDEPSSEESGVSKKHRGDQSSVVVKRDDLSEVKTLSDVLVRLEKEAPNVRISTYQRLDWLKRASSLSSSNENLTEPNLNKLGTVLTGNMAKDQVAVVELLIPSVLRAVISLHPAGSINPDAVSFFSPDEGGSYMHARGFSVHNVYKHITEFAAKALQYFLSTEVDMGLYLLLRWICSYQTLFTKLCSKCNRLLSMDKTSTLLLPPVHRPFRYSSDTKTSSVQSTNTQSVDLTTAFHIVCSLDEA